MLRRKLKHWPLGFWKKLLTKVSFINLSPLHYFSSLCSVSSHSCGTMTFFICSVDEEEKKVKSAVVPVKPVVPGIPLVDENNDADDEGVDVDEKERIVPSLPPSMKKKLKEKKKKIDSAIMPPPPEKKKIAPKPERKSVKKESTKISIEKLTKKRHFGPHPVVKNPNTTTTTTTTTTTSSENPCHLHVNPNILMLCDVCHKQRHVLVQSDGTMSISFGLCKVCAGRNKLIPNILALSA